MRLSGQFAFAVGAVLSALILHFLPFDGTRLAMQRIEERLRIGSDIQARTSRSCSILTPMEMTPAAIRLAKRLTPARGEGGGAECRLQLEKAETTKFLLRTDGRYAVRIFAANGSVVAEERASASFPRPIVLWPIVLFLLALIFDVRRWNLWATAGAYVLFASGFDLIAALQTTGRSVAATFTADPVFQGLALVLAWLGLFLTHEEPTPQTKDLSLRERLLGGIGSSAFGVWNPLIYSALGPLWFPVQRSVARIANFLDAQFLLATVSLYLLLPGARNFGEFFERSLLLPRYLTFAAVIFLAYARLNRTPGTAHSPWRSGRLLAGLSLAAVLEIVARFVPQLNAVAMPIRVGLSLLVTELPRLRAHSVVPVAKRIAPWYAFVLLGCGIDAMTLDSGIVDMVVTLVDPRMHPTLVVFLTFTSSFLASFATGGFATPFFALAAAFHGIETPSVRGAMLDGLLAGAFFSPFSLVNLLPTSQFGIDLRRTLLHRWKTLAVPLAITLTVHLLAALKSVSILPPVTFLMLCLAALAVKLQFRTWDITRFAFFRNRLPENNPEQFLKDTAPGATAEPKRKSG